MYFIGLMSGTSMDAIDTALVKIGADELELVEYEQFPIDDTIRNDVRELNTGSTLAKVTELDAILGRLFARAVSDIIRQSGLTDSDITAIGSHGQTVLHLPDAKHPRTLQIGDPNIIASETGITTVADFRRMDMAAGGQGAPLAIAFHEFQFRHTGINRIVLNLGGIANISILPGDPEAAATGFDTGPGNGLMDDWNRLHNHTMMDEDSRWAAQGNVDGELLSLLLGDPYLSLPPPKSTGRDYFNLDWLNRILSGYHQTLAPEDVQATLLRLSSDNVAQAIKRYTPESREIYVCGGGVHNPVLMDQLRQSLPDMAIDSTRALGLDPDTIEAVSFAWLAKARLAGEPGNLPAVTGAKEKVLLGGIYSPH